jgi:cyclase
MLARRIIPCLDVKNGRVVKGVQFESLRDAGDPVQCARLYDEQGADEIVFLDITASIEARSAFLHVIEQTADVIRIPLTVGGGVHSMKDIDALLRAGADKVSMNSAAVSNPGLIDESTRYYGSQAIVVAVDARRSASRGFAWEVYTHGGRTATGIDAVAWCREAAARGAGEILLTSMDRDGTQRGYNVPLTREVADAVPIAVIASGGVGSLDHFVEGFREGHADAALAASVFHDQVFTIPEVKAYVAQHGVTVRPVDPVRS